MTDRAAFIRRIVENPACDTTRLVFADWLDENGEGEYAEFIRLQCKLAHHFPAPCRACQKSLRDDRVADGCPCNSPRGVNHGIVPIYVCTCPECDPAQTGSVRDRPVEVMELYLRQDQLLPRYQNPLLWHPWTEQIRFERGFVSHFECSCAAFMADGFAARLFSQQPVTSVRLTDKEPREHNTRVPWWFAMEGERARIGLGEDEIPKELFERYYFMTRDHAQNWLSNRCVAYGREKAGLPALPVSG